MGNGCSHVFDGVLFCAILFEKFWMRSGTDKNQELSTYSWKSMRVLLLHLLMV